MPAYVTYRAALRIADEAVANLCWRGRAPTCTGGGVQPGHAADSVAMALQDVLNARGLRTVAYVHTLGAKTAGTGESSIANGSISAL